MTSASALVPLWNRGAEWERRLAMVREARSFLYLSTFYIEHDAYGTEILAALRRAQRRGVAVSLLVDAFGQRQFFQLVQHEWELLFWDHTQYVHLDFIFLVCFVLFPGSNASSFILLHLFAF